MGRTYDCIAWSCGTPIPIPTSLLPGFEAFTREEKESSYAGQSYDNKGMQSSSYGYSGNIRYTQMWSPNAETVLRYKSNDLTSSFKAPNSLMASIILTLSIWLPMLRCKHSMMRRF